MAGVFITFEGGEGVGKSSLITALQSWLIAIGKDVVLTREPGGTPLATRIRELFVSPPTGEKLTPESEFCLVSASRAQHVAHVVLPALASNKIVLCDRFADSSRVYQGEIGGLSPEVMEPVIKFTTFGREPDLTILLDCDVDVALGRLQKRAEAKGETSRFDQAGKVFHERLRIGYAKLQKQFAYRMHVINAAQEPSAVLAAAKKLIAEKVGVDGVSG